MSTEIAEQGPATKATQQATSGGERDYGRSIRAAARGLVSGIFDEFQFIDSMVSTVTRGLTRAFGEGLIKAGVQPADLNTPDYLPERLALDVLINQQQASLFGFSGYILQRKEKYYDQGEKQKALNQVFERALLWSNQYDKARQQAFVMASGNKPMTWVLGPTEHCDTCAGFAGRVYRAETWAKNGALPRVHDLCCRGFKCQCQLVPTANRVTPGRFPSGLFCR